MKYTLFQKMELAQELVTQCNNNTVGMELDFKVTRAELCNAMLKLVKLFPELNMKYTVNEIIKLKRISFEEMNNRILEFNDKDGDLLIQYLQNQTLDLSNGLVFNIALNHNTDNTSSVLLVINHCVADGVALSYLCLPILFLLLSRQFIKYYLFVLKIKITSLLSPKIDSIIFSKNSFLNYSHELMLGDFNGVDQQVAAIYSSVPINNPNRIKPLGSYISAVSLIALKSTFPAEKNFQLRKIIGLRNRLKGVHKLKFGEYHISKKYLFDKSSISSIDEIMQLLSIKQKLESQEMTDMINKLYYIDHVTDLNEYYNRNFANDYTTVAISSFGVLPKTKHLKRIIGLSSMCSGPKPNILVLCGIIGDALELGVQYNPAMVSRETINEFMENVVMIIKYKLGVKCN